LKKNERQLMTVAGYFAVHLNLGSMAGLLGLVLRTNLYMSLFWPAATGVRSALIYAGGTCGNGKAAVEAGMMVDGGDVWCNWLLTDIFW
jgi:hypothetical protein